MANNFRILPTLSLILICIPNLYSQQNPGFLGKKTAFGYNLEYCLMRTLDINDGQANHLRNFTLHEFFVEHAISKFRSITATLTYQKVPLRWYKDYNTELIENYTLYGQSYITRFTMQGGTSNFQSISLGTKFNFYNRRKTISAPVGLAHYLRIDVFFNKALENKYRYYKYEDKLTQDQLDRAYIPAPVNTQSKTLSVGYGIDTKISITQSLFIKLNGELNLSTSMIPHYAENYSSINEDLRTISHSVNGVRNFLLFGIGVGGLL